MFNPFLLVARRNRGDVGINRFRLARDYLGDLTARFIGDAFRQRFAIHINCDLVSAAAPLHILNLRKNEQRVFGIVLEHKVNAARIHRCIQPNIHIVGRDGVRTPVHNRNIRALIHICACTKQRVVKRRARLADASACLQGILFAAADTVCSLPAKFKSAGPHNRVKAPLFARPDRVSIDDIRRLADVEQAVLLGFIVTRSGECGRIFRNVLRVRLNFINGGCGQHSIDDRLHRCYKFSGSQCVFDFIRSGLGVERTAFRACDVVEAFFALPIGDRLRIRLRCFRVDGRLQLRKREKDRFPAPCVFSIEFACARGQHILNLGIIAPAVRKHLGEVIAHAQVACAERPACILQRNGNRNFFQLLFRRIFHKAGCFLRRHAAYIHAN